MFKEDNHQEILEAARVMAKDAKVLSQWAAKQIETHPTKIGQRALTRFWNSINRYEEAADAYWVALAQEDLDAQD